MAKKWSEIKARQPEHIIEAADRETRAVLVSMALTSLRQARKITQKDVASRMRVPQGSVSKLERREDMHISTLRNYVRSLGGELDIVARFPDREYHITNAEDLKQL